MNITTNNTKYEILQADINTANNIISIDNYQGSEGSDLIITPAIIFNKNSQLEDANYPKNLELNTIYYHKNESNLTSFKFYHDDAATTEVVFSDSNIEDVTAFTFAFIFNQNYLDTFFSGADSLEDLTCCPVDRKRTFLFLAVYVTPYFLNQIEVGDFFFRNDPSGHLSDFHFFPSGFTSGNVATAAMITIEEDPEDENKIIVHYRLHGTGGSYDFVNYYSESILKEDFPNVITVTTDENTGGNSYHADTMNLSFYRSGHVPQKALLYLNNAKFKSAEGDISIGDITEELTYDYRSNKYVSDLMNYNDVAGRLFLNVNFYPKKSLNVKYIKQNLINSYGNYGFIYGLIINRTWYENDDGSVYSIPLLIQGNGATTGFTHVGSNNMISTYNSAISFSSGTQYQIGGGAVWLDPLSFVINNDYSMASTPGLTYLAVGYAVTTAVVKSGYPNTGQLSDEYTNFDDDEFYKENLISVFSESSSSFIQSIADVVYPSPTITETNDLIIPEDPLVITGTDFDLVSSNNDIIFHIAGLKAEIISSTSTTITINWINPPESDGYYYAIIATQYGDSGYYTKIGFLGTEPTITFNDDVIPQNAATLIITGTGFNTTAANNLVTFNLGAVGTVTAATATELTVTFTTQPTSLGNLEVTLLMPLSSGAAVQVATVVAEITVTENMDTRTKKNKIIVISGTGFSATANENTVTFNLGAVGTVTSATTTELTITFSTQPTTTGSLTAVVENNIFNFDSGSAVQVADVDENTTIVEEFYIDKTVARSLNIHSNGLFLYCTSYDETEEKRQIDLYSINNSTGVLSLITSYVKDNPIQDMLISSDGINLYVNYVDNTIETYSIDSETGYLNLEDDFQIAGLASCIVRISPDLKNIYIASIQETYQTEMIYVYDRNLSTGIITEAETIAWLQDIGYLSNMIISDDGKHLYFRFFNDNTTGIFTRNLSTGLLTFNATQNIDIDFIKSNNIVFLRNTGGDNGLIDIYLRNTTNGSLSYSAQTGSVGNNNLLDVIQANEFAVVKNFDVIGGEIRAYSINPADGVLTFSDSFPTTPETAGSPFLLSSAQTPDNKFFYLSSVLVVGNPGTNEYSKITVFQL